jgi:invasion protein IalB
LKEPASRQLHVPARAATSCVFRWVDAARIGPDRRSQIQPTPRLHNMARWRRAVTPLGVLLPSGLGLKLDNQDVGRAGFVRCLPNGCVAEVVMDDKLLGQLRTAKTATFIIFETSEEGIGFR